MPKLSPEQAQKRIDLCAQVLEDFEEQGIKPTGYRVMTKFKQRFGISLSPSSVRGYGADWAQTMFEMIEYAKERHAPTKKPAFQFTRGGYQFRIINAPKNTWHKCFYDLTKIGKYRMYRRSIKGGEWQHHCWLSHEGMRHVVGKIRHSKGAA